MWRKHWITFQYHVKYIHNDIVKPFRFSIPHYSECARKMHNLAKYLPPPSMTGGEYDRADRTARDKEFTEHDICVETKDRLLTYMQDEF